ncbi:hypothetical protein Tco_0558982 [Tanacetum coccineum]
MLGRPPSLGIFCRFYCNSISNGWLSFSKRGSTPCCVSKPLDSLKNLNDHFFYIDAFVCPVHISWYNNVSVSRVSLPSDKIVDFPLMENLNENHTLIRRYPEAFLCIVGLSHSFVDTDVRSTLLCPDNNDMGLLDFVKSANPFKVKVGERTLGEGEVPLLTKTADMVVPLSAQTIRLVNHTLVDELREIIGKKKSKVAFNAGPPPVKRERASGVVILKPNPTTVGKSPVIIQKLIAQSGQPNVGSRSAAPHAEEFVSSFVAPTPDHEC